jgi:hypothetical protein
MPQSGIIKKKKEKKKGGGGVTSGANPVDLKQLMHWYLIKKKNILLHIPWK